MTREHLDAWLDARRPDRPAALDERMARAVREAPDARLAAADSLARLLGGIGLALLGDVKARPPQAPGLALDLLAADAFVTYAVEAAAEEGLDVAPLVRELVREAAA